MKSSKKAEPSGEQDLTEAVAAVAAATAGEPGDPGDDFYEELVKLQKLGSGERAFSDGRALLETEQLENDGVWGPVPFLAGAELQIAHQTAGAERREELEVKFREKYKIPPGQPLSAKQREVIWRESYFGPIVKNWRGFKLDGELQEFTAANFRRFMTSRRFRMHVVARSLENEAFRADRDGAIRGNS